jgi:hypothetical protein
VINFSFNIIWPWFNDDAKYYKEYFYESWKVSKNKSLEIQIDRGGKTLIGFDLGISTRCDHGGIMIGLDLFRRQFILTFSDNRHWNEDKGRYLNYDDPKEIEEY